MFQAFVLSVMWSRQANKQTNKKNNPNLQKWVSWHLYSSKKQYKIKYVSTSKNSPKQLFRHIWLFNMSRKPFLICTASPSSQTTNSQELAQGFKSQKEMLHKVKIKWEMNLNKIVINIIYINTSDHTAFHQHFLVHE